MIVVDATDNDVTITLPSAVGTDAQGMPIYIVRCDGSDNIVTIEPQEGELICEQTSVTIDHQYKTALLFSNGVGPCMVDLSTNDFTDEYKDKLDSLTGGRMLGVFADLDELQTEYPVGVLGDHATVTDPTSNMWYWDATLAAWADSGTGSEGDMLKAMYDPTSKEISVYLMSSMEETTDFKILTSAERSAIALNTAKISYPTEDSEKLAGIQALAEVNNISGPNATDLTDGGESTLHYHDSDRARSNHTGTQLASTISDLTSTINALIEAANYGIKVYYAESLAESTTDDSWETKVTLSIPETFEAGDYFIEVNYGWLSDNPACSMQSRVVVDSVSLGTVTHEQEPKDTSNQHVAFRRFKRTLTAGVHTIDLDYGSAGNCDTTVWDASIAVTNINIQS